MKASLLCYCCSLLLSASQLRRRLYSSEASARPRWQPASLFQYSPFPSPFHSSPPLTLPFWQDPSDFMCCVTRPFPLVYALQFSHSENLTQSQLSIYFGRTKKIHFSKTSETPRPLAAACGVNKKKCYIVSKRYYQLVYLLQSCMLCGVTWYRVQCCGEPEL